MVKKSLEQRIEELEIKVKELTKSKIAKICKNLKIGDTFELVGLEWKILDITDKGYMCLANKLENSMKFDTSTNNWKTSKLREYLHGEFYEKLSDEIGQENIISFERDLLSLDGQDEYGVCEDKASLLNVDEYRKYRKLIPNADYWWWLITPDSTACNNDSDCVRVVSPSGYFSSFNFCDYYYGVRPFCIFSSVIFESEE